MKFLLGSFEPTPAVVERLQQLDFTVPEFIEAANEHQSSLCGNPSIYCGTYAKYNEGSIDGLWIDLTTFSDFDEFINFCLALHADEEDPELMFQDYEGFPYGMYSECMGRSDFEEIAEFFELCKGYTTEAVEDYYDLRDSLRHFEESFEGRWDSEEDFARYLIRECYDLSPMGDLERYFDYQAFADDLFRWDYTMTENGYVFREL